MELNHLLALNQVALSHVRLVERERYLRTAHDAYRYVRLLACEVGVRSEVARCKCAQLLGCLVERSRVHAALLQDSYGFVCAERVEVFATRCDDEARHVERTRTDEALLLAVGEVAVGTMLRAWYHHHLIVVAVAPCYDVHHRLGVAAVHRQRRIELAEELFARVLVGSAYREYGHGEAAYGCYRTTLIVLYEHFGVAAQSGPVGLQRQHARTYSLEVHVVGSRRATLRSVIEHRQRRIGVEQSVNLAIVHADALRTVRAQRNGEVLRHDREGVDEQREVLVHLLLHLLLRSVLLAEEAGALGDGLAVDVCACRDDACGVELQLERNLAARQLARLHVAQVVEVLSGILPHLQLAVEEALQRTVG